MTESEAPGGRRAEGVARERATRGQRRRRRRLLLGRARRRRVTAEGRAGADTKALALRPQGQGRRGWTGRALDALSRWSERRYGDRLPYGVEIETAGLALRLLAARLGWGRALRVGVRLARMRSRGEPFAALGPPADAADRLSRAQIAPAILLYRILEPRLGAEAARRLLAEVVEAATLVFLRHTVGPLHRDVIEAMPPEGRERWARDVGAQFFNATIQWEQVDAEEVRFRVIHCRFPALCAAAGVPELAPLFCAGDAVYFGQELGTVNLERAHTLAEGGPDCPFRLTWKPARDPGSAPHGSAG